MIGWFTCLFISFSSSAQDKNKIIGRWQVAALDGDNMYFDFKKDSFAVTGEKAKGLTKKQVDSLHAEARTIMAEAFAGSFFEFNADMSCTERAPMRDDVRKGTYTIDETAKVIIIQKERKSSITGQLVRSEEKIPYRFNADRLVFAADAKDSGPDIILEKLPKD